MKKYNPITLKQLKEICPSFGNWDRCKWWFPFKDISKINTPEYANGKWVFKKGLDRQCLLNDLCQDADLLGEEEEKWKRKR